MGKLRETELTQECRKLGAALSKAMDEKEAAEAKLAKAQDEISVLLEWVLGDRDALSCLQSIYNSTTASEANRAKAAAAAIAYERPKPAASLVVMDFAERVKQARLKSYAKLLAQPKVIEHIPGEHQPEPTLPESA